LSFALRENSTVTKALTIGVSYAALSIVNYSVMSVNSLESSAEVKKALNVTPLLHCVTTGGCLDMEMTTHLISFSLQVTSLACTY